ncbi:MAG: RNA polymerase sigma factor, partial [Acutalibacteraceae bacterium]
MEDLFEKIYRENFSRVYAFLFKMTRDPDLSEELTQETFYQAFVSFHRFEGKCDIFT